MHLKTDKVDLKKGHREKKFFCIFFQSTHQVGMKNIVKCYKDFFGYFNALKTHCDTVHLVFFGFFPQCFMFNFKKVRLFESLE